MRTTLALVASAALALPLAARAHGPEGHEDHAPAASAPHRAAASAAADAPAPAVTRDPDLPAGDETAKLVLETSPRHGELLDVVVPGDSVKLRTWIVYPERRERAGVVILVHDIYGLGDWIRAVADQVAREGFIAVVPDLVSGLGPGGGGTESAAGRDDVVKMVRGLTAPVVRARLDAVHAWGLELPAANGKSGTLGFCWGGTKSFEYAAWQPALDAAVVFYGPAPDSATLGQVRAPVLGLYGGDDARVNTTIDPARARLAALGRSYEAHLFDGAGHGFVKQQGGREGANLRATRGAWPLAIAFLRRHLE